MKSAIRRLWLAGLGVCAVVGVAQPAAGVMCNGDGATLLVDVRNDTPDTPTVTIRGDAVNATCGSAWTWYETTCTLAANATTTCSVNRPGINSGVWLHRISWTTGTYPFELQVKQHQKSVVVFHPIEESRIAWTYFPKVIKVNRAGGDGPTQCPVNATPYADSCDIRDAIWTAQPGNLGGGSDPIMIMVDTSPGGIGDGHIVNGRANLTIDGTDANGKPWIVADPAITAAGGQDAFSRAIQFEPDYGLKMNGTNVTLRGLEIRQRIETETGISNSVIEIGENGWGFRLVNSRVDGMMDQDCMTLPNNCAQFASGIEVAPRTGPLPSGVKSATIENSEIHSAIYAGVEIRSWGSVDIRDSWLRNNYRSNAVAENAAALIVERSVVERAGLRDGDDAMPLSYGVPAGVIVTRPGSDGPANMTFSSLMSIYRNNVWMGIWGIGDGATLAPFDDVVCGNLASGIYTGESGASTGAPIVNSAGGIGLVYNGTRGVGLDGHGASVLPETSVGYDFDSDSAFTANRDCGLLNRSQTYEVSATGNQWRDVDPNDPNDPPSFDDCESSGGGPVDTSLPQDEIDTVPGVLDTFPSNALHANQTVRVSGQFFDAISGNPLSADPNDPQDPGASCALGVDVSGEWNGTGTPQAASCCNDATRSNTCGPIVGNCVQVVDAQSNVKNLKVKAVSPRLIEAQLPTSTLSCVGGSGEELTVTKLDRNGIPIRGVLTVCTPS